MDVGERLRDGADGRLHEESVADHQVVVLGGEVRQVGDVLIAGLGLDHVALDMELVLGLGKADERQMVEALVVQAARVGDQADLERFGSAARGAAARGDKHQCHEHKAENS